MEEVLEKYYKIKQIYPCDKYLVNVDNAIHGKILGEGSFGKVLEGKTKYGNLAIKIIKSPFPLYQSKTFQKILKDYYPNNYSDLILLEVQLLKMVSKLSLFCINLPLFYT
jgi:hypothetical protein